MAEWIVKHKNHDDTIRDEVRPMNLDFTMRRGVLGPGEISYDVSLANSNMKWGYVGSKRTEWELWRDDQKIAAGHHMPYRTAKGSNLLTITGQTYLVYLFNRHYPFDPTNPNLYLGGTAASFQGLAYQAKKDIALIIDDVLTKIMSRPNSLQIFYAPEELGIVEGVRIELADTESFGDKLTAWAQISPGFDFEVDEERRLFLYSPGKYLTGADSQPSQTSHVFDRWVIPTDITSLEFENEGPSYTHLLAMGAGTSSRLGVALSYPQSEEIFGRWDGNEDFGDVINKPHLTNLAQDNLSRALYPQRNLPMSVNPAEINDFWGTFTGAGQAIWVREDFEAQNVDEAWIVDELNCRVSSVGEERVTFALSRLDPYGKPGIPRA